LGAHIGHDGGHYAISRFPFVNDILVWCMSFISNPIVWQHQHTYAHHSFTNEHNNDPDLHHFSLFMRYNTIQKLLPQYKMQTFAVYIFWAFGFTSNGTLYWNLWRFIFERSIHGTVQWTDRKRWYRTALLLCHMFAYPILNFVVPYWYHRNLVSAIVCGVIHMVTAGFLFALVSQVGHITEMALVRDPAQKSRAEIAKGSWAADQVETTNDFCPQSTVMMFFGGNLGVQIEHHLFPCLNHCHLQMIQPTVEHACREFGLSYKKYNGWTDAMTDTITYLQTLSHENKGSMGALSSVSRKID
jgi:fatty acid desaturase